MKLTKIVLLSLFILLFFALRFPDYSRLPTYEEGMFAEIFYNQPSNPKYLLVGRIDGENIYSAPQHPALMYEILGIYGKIWQHLLPIDNYSPIKLTFVARLAFSLFQSSIFLFMIVLIGKGRSQISEREKYVLLVLGVIFLSSTPLAIDTSLSLQIDGSVGVLFSGILALALFAYHYQVFPLKISNIVVFLSAIFYGWGKNEWSIALFGALILSFVALFVKSKRTPNKNTSDVSVLLLVFLGLALGNGISYLFDPPNYLAGFDVMTRIHGVSNYSNLLSLAIARFPSIAVIVVLLIVQLFGLVNNFSNTKATQLILFFWGGILFFGFFVSPWASDLRYFAPSLVVCVVGVMLLMGTFWDNFKQKKLFNYGIWLAYIYMATLAFIQIVGIFSQIPDYQSQVAGFDNVELPNTVNEDCLPIMGVGEAFGQGIDFISNALSLDHARLLAEDYKHSLCK